MASAHGGRIVQERRGVPVQADALLLQERGANNLLLGVTWNAIEHLDWYEAFRGWVVIDEGKPVGSAAQTCFIKLILGVSESKQARAAQYALSPRT